VRFLNQPCGRAPGGTNQRVVAPRIKDASSRSAFDSRVAKARLLGQEMVVDGLTDGSYPTRGGRTQARERGSGTACGRSAPRQTAALRCCLPRGAHATPLLCVSRLPASSIDLRENPHLHGRLLLGRTGPERLEPHG
jgi:hypothetical protein